MFSKQLIHLEHIGRICLKHQAEGIITNYLSLVTRILEVVFPNVCPKLLHNLNQARWSSRVTSRYSITTSQNLISEPDIEKVHFYENKNLCPWHGWLANNSLKFS